VVVNVVGALAEILKVPENRVTFYGVGGVEALLKLQVGTTNHQLIVNVNNTLAECAQHPPSMV